MVSTDDKLRLRNQFDARNIREVETAPRERKKIKTLRKITVSNRIAAGWLKPGERTSGERGGGRGNTQMPAGFKSGRREGNVKRGK